MSSPSALIWLSLEKKAVPVKAMEPMAVSVDGSERLSRVVQAAKAIRPMVATPSGMTTAVRASQPLKALLSMAVTL